MIPGWQLPSVPVRIQPQSLYDSPQCHWWAVNITKHHPTSVNPSPSPPPRQLKSSEGWNKQGKWALFGNLSPCCFTASQSYVFWSFCNPWPLLLVGCLPQLELLWWSGFKGLRITGPLLHNYCMSLCVCSPWIFIIGESLICTWHVFTCNQNEATTGKKSHVTWQSALVFWAPLQWQRKFQSWLIHKYNCS